MNTTDVDPRTPEQIERSIEARRQALKDKLTALEHRLSPSERMRDARQRLDRVREQLDVDTIAPWAAVGAVATGAILAARGLRRRQPVDGGAQTDVIDTIEETICIEEDPYLTNAER